MATGRQNARPGVDAQPRPRAQLDATTILDAALRLAEAGGSEPLTVRRLGRELGADPTAIYRHFRDKDELVRGALDRLIADVVDLIDPGAPWRDRLTELAVETIRTMCAHPSIGSQAAMQTTGGEGELAAIELVLQAMNDAGLSREDSVRFYAVYSSYVIAISSARCGSLLSSDGDADDEERWIGPSPALRRSRHPTIALVRDELEALSDRDVYTAGVQVILDAVEARAAATTG